MNLDPVQRIKLIMSYDLKKTLNENIELNELGGEKGLADLLKSAESTEKKLADLAQFFKVGEDVAALANAKDLTTLNKDFTRAVAADVKEGFVGKGAALGKNAKQVAKQLAIKEILSSSKELSEQDIIQIIERIKNETKLQAVKIETRTAAKKPGTEQTPKNVTPDSAAPPIQTADQVIQSTDNIQKQIEKDAASGNSQAAAVKEDVENLIKKTEENTKGERWKKWKEALSKLGGWWKWVKRGLLVGGGIYAYDVFTRAVKDPTSPVFEPCVANLLDDDSSMILATNDGNPVLYLKKTGDPNFDAAGGLQFFTNNRVFYSNGKRRGTYSCSGGSLSTDTDTENSSTLEEQNAGEITQDQLNKLVDKADSDLSYWVTEKNLRDLYSIVNYLTGKTFKGSNAISAFLNFYKGTYDADFNTKVQLVSTHTMGALGYQLKQDILRISTAAVGGDKNKATGLGNIIFNWDEASTATTDDTTTDPLKKDKIDSTKPKPEDIDYHDCSGKKLENGDTLELGCISPYVKNLQQCAISKGIDLGPGGADGRFGPSTSAYLNAKTIDKTVYDQYMAMCGNQSQNTTGETKKTSDNASTVSSTQPITTPEAPTSTDKTAPSADILATKAQTTTPEQETSNVEAGRQIYQELYDNYNNGKQKPFIKTRGNRLVYKGNKFPKEKQGDLNALNAYIESLGYQFEKEKDRDREDYSEKYVWVKKPEQPAAAPATEPSQLSEEKIKNIVSKHLYSRLK
jgi:hypothetical protein